MNRSRKILTLALNKIAKNLESERSESNVGSFIIEAAISKKRNTSKETDIFESPVLNETASSFNYGVNFDVENISRSFSFFDFDDDDNSIKDPDFFPSSEFSNSEESVVSENTRQAATLLERNLSDHLEQMVSNSDIEVINTEDCVEETKENRSTRKANKNTGKAYTTRSGKLIQARKFKPLVGCRKKCMTKISAEDQKNIFEKYWALADYNLRHAYVCGLIVVEETKSKRTSKHGTNPRNRNFSNYYFLEVHGKRTSVCQKCFRSTLSETEQFIKTVVRKKLASNGTTTQPDQRGSGVSNKIETRAENEIRDHINSFPSYESHYTRRDTAQKYFHSSLTLSTMYKLYCEKHESVASISTYSKIFKTMNIKFKKPKLDTCHRCEILKTKIEMEPDGEGRLLLKTEQENHHKAADLAYESKSKDKEYAKNNDSTKVFSFDLQQCLPTPFLRTNVSFYKRQLWTYNLTIHDCVVNQAFCYMWDESTANRGGNEIASCVFQHLKTIPPDVKHLIFYSDCCAGQNKNGYVATMFEIFCNNSYIDVIDHKFLVPGHTHMECDVDHAAIERKKKASTVKIHHPRDWYQLVRSVGKKPFIVHEMTRTDFLDFAKMSKEKFVWRKIADDKSKFVWQNIKWLRFTREFGIVQFKTSLDENEAFKVLNIKKRGKNAVDMVEVPHCYSGPNTISKEKKKDLLELLPVIEKSYHDFYLNLQSDDIFNYHPDLTDDENEEEN